MITAILSTALLFFFLFLRKTMSTGSRSAEKLPPSPWSLPLIGNLHQLGRLPHRSLRALSEKHGPLMLLRLGQVPTIVVSSSELAQEVMKKQDLNFANRPQLAMAKRLLYNCTDVAFSRYDEHWKQVRKIFVFHMLSAKQVHFFRPIRDDEVKLMLAKIRTDSTNNRRPVNLTEIFASIPINIVCRAAFGKAYSKEKGGERMREMIREFMTLLGAFPVADYIPCISWVDRVSGLNARSEKNAKDLDAFLEKVIDDHMFHKDSQLTTTDTATMKASPDLITSHDFVDILLSLNAEHEKDSSSTSGRICFTRETIKPLILDMILGGTDTTTAAMEWTMAELIRHPSILNKAQKEVRKVFGSKGHVVEGDEDMAQLHYLKAAIKESMRIHPPAPLLVMRESINDAVLGGYHVPANTRVIINSWAISRDPKSWPESPEEFLPERFMANPNLDFKGQDLHYTPFGSGRRICPGIHFATPTIELVLANLLYHFDWKLPEGKEDLLMDEEPGIVVPMKSDLILEAIPPLHHA